MEYGRVWEDIEGEEYIVYRKYWKKKDKDLMYNIFDVFKSYRSLELYCKWIGDSKSDEEMNNRLSKFDLKFSYSMRIDFIRVLREYGWKMIYVLWGKYVDDGRVKRDYVKKDDEEIKRLNDLGFRSL